MESAVEILLNILDLGYFEVGEAFDGLADEHVWKRPAEGLLSIGEIAGHVAYWEAVRLAGEHGNPLPDPANCRVKSPLIDTRFAYYTHTLPTPPSDEHQKMTAKEVHSELVRVHQESVAYFKSLKADLDGTRPGYPGGNTYREFLKYATFHISYHTGQMYSARHLLGEKTPDN